VREMTLALANWRSTITLLMVQYFGQKAKAGKFSLLLVIAEPFIFILSLYIIRGVIRDKTPSYGTSLLLFFCSGMMPYYIFIRTSILSRSTIKPLQPVPRIRSMDVIMAQVAANAVLWGVVMVLLFFGLWMYGIQDAWPESIPTCLYALLLMLCLGAGAGLFNASVDRYFPLWSMIFGICTRGMVFFSGVMSIADRYPLPLRDYLAWNPLLHGVDLFRVGLYGSYPHYLLDVPYLEKCAAVLLFVGFIAERASLRFGGR